MYRRVIRAKAFSGLSHERQAASMAGEEIPLSPTGRTPSTTGASNSRHRSLVGFEQMVQVVTIPLLKIIPKK